MASSDVLVRLSQRAAAEYEEAAHHRDERDGLDGGDEAPEYGVHDEGHVRHELGPPPHRRAELLRPPVPLQPLLEERVVGRRRGRRRRRQQRGQLAGQAPEVRRPPEHGDQPPRHGRRRLAANPPARALSVVGRSLAGGFFG